MPKKLTQQTFIERSRSIHGDRYDYKKVDYVNYDTKVKIICPIHGIFLQVPRSHVKGIGCKLCAVVNNANRKRKCPKQFIQDANNVHNGRYDYSLIDYKNAFQNIIIKCKIHGNFSQRPNDHLNGLGCPKCGIRTRLEKAKNRANTEREVLDRFYITHGNKYDYSLVVYKTVHDKVKIICPEHGIFEQSPQPHLSGQGCPKCSGRYGPTYLYLMELIGPVEQFIKIGISSRSSIGLRKRYIGQVYDVVNLFVAEFGGYEEAYQSEQDILKQLNKWQYVPIKDFGGKTECLMLDCSPVVLEMYNFKHRENE